MLFGYAHQIVQLMLVNLAARAAILRTRPHRRSMRFATSIPLFLAEQKPLAAAGQARSEAI